MPTGMIKVWNDTRGFGFIASDFGPDYFMHAKYIKQGYTPIVGDRVEFEIVTDQRTLRPRADNVRPVADDENVEWLNEHRARHANDRG